MRDVDPSHPFVSLIVEQLGDVQTDGTFSGAAVDAMRTALLPLSGERLADALWHGLVFAAFVGTKLGADAAGAQILNLVEDQTRRLPADTRSALSDARESAAMMGTQAALTPVGSGATPDGSVRGGLAARLAATKPKP